VNGAVGDSAAGASPAPAWSKPRRGLAAVRVLIRITVPVMAGLILGAVILALLGRNPWTFYSDLFRAGLISHQGWQAMLTRLAPLLLMSAGYVVAFRAGLWNIGGDGQFLLAAAFVAGLSPTLVAGLPRPLALLLLGLLGMAVGGVWTLLPSYLKAWFGVNEIITTVMMSFIGMNLAALLIKEAWRTESVMVPQTDAVPLDQLLPRLGGTTIHAGIIVAGVVVLAVWYVLRYTATGLRLTVLGASPAAARHAGLPVRRLIVGAFFASGALVGLGAALEILGVWGYMRADWNPKFGLALFALVFLARLDPLGAAPLATFYAVLDIGGHEAARTASLDSDFILVLVGLILLCLAAWQVLRLPAGERLTWWRCLGDRLRLRDTP